MRQDMESEYGALRFDLVNRHLFTVSPITDFVLNMAQEARKALAVRG
jgi:hypothetical protein